MVSRIDQIIEHESAAAKLEIKAADDHKWEAARLIAEELASGTTQRALAKAIGKKRPHIQRMLYCWERRGSLRIQQSFNAFYNSEIVRGPKKIPKPKPEPGKPDFLNGKVVELSERKVIKLELTPKEFKILQRAINPECKATEEQNASLMFVQSFKRRHGSIKEIPQLY